MAFCCCFYFEALSNLAEAGGVTARMRRARRSRPTLLRVTLADGVAPPACGDRWSTSGKIQAGALIRLRDRATVILKVFRDYNPWQGFHIDVRSEVGRSRSAFVCDFGVTRPASRVAWVIPGLWPFVAQLTKSLVIVFPRKAQKARNGDREWRFVVASISRRLVLSLLRTKALLAYGRVHRLEDSSCPDHF